MPITMKIIQLLITPELQERYKGLSFFYQGEEPISVVSVLSESLYVNVCSSLSLSYFLFFFMVFFLCLWVAFMVVYNCWIFIIEKHDLAKNM
jgi:hypothetical protein